MTKISSAKNSYLIANFEVTPASEHNANVLAELIFNQFYTIQFTTKSKNNPCIYPNIYLKLFSVKKTSNQ